MTTFQPPQFDRAPLDAAPDATFVPADHDGVLREGFFSTTNLPTICRTVVSAAAPALGARR